MGKRILVVEDEPQSFQPFFAALEQHGHRVVAHASLAKARALLKHCAWEVALVDVRMESAEWREFARQLHQACPDVRVIYVTANGAAFEAFERDIPAAHNNLFLTRPIDIRVLLRLI